MLISLRFRINLINYYGYNDHDLVFVDSYSVRDCVLEPLKEAGL